MKNFILHIIYVLGVIGFNAASASASASVDVLHLATSTSTVSSGLFTKLIPEFEGFCNCKVDIAVVGTGKALQMGRLGKVDVVLAHAPLTEKKFVADGYGVSRRAVMHNDFVVIGPSDDPAGIREAGDIVGVLQKIVVSKSLFISRADDSGTHKKERQIWKEANIEPYGGWYYEAGLNMSKALSLANSKQAYALIDRGTWLSKRGNLSLKVLFEGDARLYNPYSVIVVNPEKNSNTNYKLAIRFADWITSDRGQQIIKDYRLMGKSLFVPDAMD